MARKTNCSIGDNYNYYRVRVKKGIKKDSDGTWKPDFQSFYGKTKAEAIAKRDDYLLQRERNHEFSDEYAGILIDKWIETIFKQSSDYAENTKKKYIRGYRKVFESSEAAGTRINKLTPLDIQDVYNNSECCNASKADCHKLLRLFFKYADVSGLCRDITTSLSSPKGSSSSKNDPVSVWDDANLKKVINALEGTTLRFLVVLAVNAGPRISELLALTYDDIHDGCLYINKQLSDGTDLDGNTKPLQIEKTKTINSNRVIPLSDAVIKEFEKHKAIHQAEMQALGYETNNIFTSSNGTYLYRRNVIRSLERLYSRIDVPYRNFHSYRHTFGTNLSRAGVPIEQTAMLMGHSNIEITAKYYININAAQKKAAVESIAAYSLDS